MKKGVLLTPNPLSFTAFYPRSLACLQFHEAAKFNTAKMQETVGQGNRQFAGNSSLVAGLIG